MSHTKTPLYKAALMDHFKKPRNKQQGPFPAHMRVGRGRNPSCGDDIEVGIDVETGELAAVIGKIGFRGRGCSVCLASASMMTEAVAQMSSEQALALADVMQRWIDKSLGDESAIPEQLQPLSAVKDHPARKKCVMLAWDALQEAIECEGDAPKQSGED